MHGRNGSANLLHGLAYYSNYNERFDLIRTLLINFYCRVQVPFSLPPQLRLSKKELAVTNTALGQSLKLHNDQ